MNQQQRETLERLRDAVRQDQWNEWREVLAKLLPDIKQTDLISVVAKQARRFLSDFSRTYPEDERIGSAIEAFNDISTLEALDQQGRMIDHILDTYWDSPGVSNFRNAFKGISRPQQYFDHYGDFIDTVISLLSGISIATEANDYWGDNPEFSKTFFGSDVRKAVLMLAKHHSDPKQIAIRTSLWNDIAKDLEMVL